MIKIYKNQKINDKIKQIPKIELIIKPDPS